MTEKEQIKMDSGSGSISADVGLDADLRHIKSQIAIAIVKCQLRLKLTMRAAAKLAECDASDIQRIRNADLKNFTIDRLIRYAINMGCKVELKVTLPKAA